VRVPEKQAQHQNEPPEQRTEEAQGMPEAVWWSACLPVAAFAWFPHNRFRLTNGGSSTHDGHGI